jgi:phage gp36-like protein
MALVYTSVTGLKSHISEDVLSELTDDTPDGVDEEVTSILTQSLEEAESFVDSYAAVVYDLPLATVPSSLKRAAYIVAKYDLLLRRHVIEDDTRLQYEGVIQWLEWLAEGKVALTEEGEETTTDQTERGFATSDEDDNENAIFVIDSNVFA